MIRHPGWSRWFASRAILMVTLAGQAAWAAPPPVELVDVQFGLGNVCKVGSWVPCVVRLRATRKIEHVRVSVILPDPEGIACRYESFESQHLGTRRVTDAVLLVRLGRLHSRIRTVVHDSTNGEETLAEWTFNTQRFSRIVDSSSVVVLVLGKTAQGVDSLQFRQQPDGIEAVSSQLLDPDRLPVTAAAYDGVDVVWLRAGDADFVREMRTEQWSALESWVLQGGRLLVTLGANTAAMLSDMDSPLSRLLQVSASGIVNQRGTTGLETYAGSASRLDVRAKQQERPWEGVPAVQLQVLDGRIEAVDGTRADRTIWVVRKVRGMGVITMLAGDSESEPLAEWDGRGKLLNRLLGLQTRRTETDAEISQPSSLRHLGYQDLAGQLRMSLDQFQGVRLISFEVVLGLIVLYLILIGPADFILTSRWWGRATATWVTLPVIVALTCGLGGMLTRSWKGNTPRSRQLDVVDLDMVSGTARGGSWLRLYVPHAERVSLRAMPESSRLPAIRLESQWCGWQGLPGKGLGGMSSQTETALPGVSYSTIGGPATTIPEELWISELPIAAHGSRGVIGRWFGRGLSVSMPALTANRSALLTGAVKNPLPVALRDCGLYFGRWYYEIGDLEPDSQALIDLSSRPLDLVTKLMRRTVIEDREVTSLWDKTDTNLARIAEIMMFHEAAGGSEYTHLQHRAESRWDFSEQLGLNRAILVGRAARPITIFRQLRPHAEVPLEPEAVTFVRLLLPVTSTRE